jgi:histidyl-tRNA synthetase
MTAAMFEKLGIKSSMSLQLNSLGTPESRKAYRELLVKYLTKQKAHLDEDSTRRLLSNPLRILDSKNPDMRKLIQEAPKLIDHLDPESLAHFEKLQSYLTHMGLKYEINPNLVRGLDYYSKTVFEWVTDHLGAQGTVCAGGRYDGLVEQLGGKPTPAVGFAIGMERTILLLQETKSKAKEETALHAYMISDSDAAFEASLKLAAYLRAKAPSLHLVLHCGGGSIKNQFKKADKSGALYAIIIGEHELKTRSASLKSLREDIPQQTLYQDELAEYLKLKISRK